MAITTKRSLLFLSAGVVVGWASASWARWARQQLLQWLCPLGPLKLQRPLVVFDIESTGLNVSKDRILEIAAVKVWPDGKVEVKGPQRLNPKVHIPAEVTAIHHITQEDLEGCPSFGQVAAEWRAFLEGCDLAGYNAKKFDVPIIRNEFRRAGQFNFPPLGVPVVDAFRIFCQQEPRTLSAAVQFYCGRTHSKVDAHSALGDAWATLKVLVEQVRRYGELPRGVAELAAMCAKPGRAQDITPDGKFQWRGDQPIVAFGKHGGEPIAVLIARHKDHLMWMSGQDWGDETLLLVGQALKGLLPTKDGGWRPLFDTPPPDPSAAAAAAATSSSSRRRSQENTQQQDEQQQQQQQKQDAGQQQHPQQQDSSSSTQVPAAPEPAAHPQQPPAEPTSAGASRQTATAAAPPPAAFTGWPELDADTMPAQTADSWSVAPAAPAPDGWSVAPAAAVPDGWSLLDTVRDYEGNPGPQTPREEPEVWDDEGSGQQQQQEQEQQQEQQGWEQEQQGWGEEQHGSWGSGGDPHIGEQQQQ